MHSHVSKGLKDTVEYLSRTRVTFIVLAYNHEDYINECLESIESQDTAIDEIIIVDDASVDGTREIINKFVDRSTIESIVFLKNDENQGLIHSLEMAFDASTGDVVILQSGDDLSSLDRTKVTLDLFSKKSLSVLYSSYEIIDDKNVTLKTVSRSGKIDDPLFFIRKGSAAPSYGAAYSREFLQYLPKMCKGLQNEDDFIGMAAVIHGSLFITKKSLYKYRIHKNSLSAWSTMELNNSAYLRLFFDNQSNTINNLLAWKKLIIDAIDMPTNNRKKTRLYYLSNLVDKKINIISCIQNCDEIKYSTRILTILINIKVINIFNLLILVAGKKGALFIRNARRIRLNIKS